MLWVLSQNKHRTYLAADIFLPSSKFHFFLNVVQKIKCEQIFKNAAFVQKNQKNQNKLLKISSYDISHIDLWFHSFPFANKFYSIYSSLNHFCAHQLIVYKTLTGKERSMHCSLKEGNQNITSLPHI